MKTSGERSHVSAVPQPSTDARPEAFDPPSFTDLASLTDGRREASYKSAYPASAWFQITLELVYLLAFLVIAFGMLALIAKNIVFQETSGLIFKIAGPYPASGPLLTWAAVTLGGACGGCAFALKWLYHTVAKMRWHRDRIIWRVVVPMLSAVLAAFLGLMVVSGLVPFLNKAPLSSPAVGAAFGFFVGIFSDNVLSGLQKLAFRIFGTVDRNALERAPDHH